MATYEKLVLIKAAMPVWKARRSGLTLCSFKPNLGKVYPNNFSFIVGLVPTGGRVLPAIIGSRPGRIIVHHLQMKTTSKKLGCTTFVNPMNGHLLKVNAFKTHNYNSVQKHYRTWCGGGWDNTWQKHVKSYTEVRLSKNKFRPFHQFKFKVCTPHSFMFHKSSKHSLLWTKSPLFFQSFSKTAWYLHQLSVHDFVRNRARCLNLTSQSLQQV